MGTISDNLVTFDGGFQMTLLPGGMYMGCPCNVAKSVAESKSFHLEFCWLESPGKRQRLVRTYDIEGLAVSTSYFSETKMWSQSSHFLPLALHMSFIGCKDANRVPTLHLLVKHECFLFLFDSQACRSSYFLILQSLFIWTSWDPHNAQDRKSVV